MAKNTIEIIIKADGSQAVRGVEQASGAVGKLGSGIGAMAAVAGGTLIAGAISAMGSFFQTVAGGAIEAVGNAQNLEIALEGLLTQSLMYERVTESVQVANSATAEQTQRLKDLQIQQTIQAAQMQEQRQRIIEMSAAWGENGLNVQTAQAKLAKMENTASKTAAEIAKLESATSGYSTVTSVSMEKVLDLADAQGLAKQQAEELLKGVKELAIVSPFETTQIENMTKLGIAAGLSADEVLGFTEAFMGISAVAGVQNIEFAAGQFLQMQKIGKMTTIDLRQLRNMGIDVERMLSTQLGMTVEQFNKEAEKSPEIWKELNKALVSFASETGAKDALDRMSLTVTGLGSTMSDAFELGSRDFFRPVIEAVSPFVAELIGTMSDLVTGGQLSQLGAQVGEYLTSEAIPKIQELYTWLQTNIPMAIQTVSNYWTGTLQPAVQMAMDYITGTVIPTLTDLYAWVQTNLPVALEYLSNLWETRLQPAVQIVGDYITNDLIPFFNELWVVLNDFATAIMPDLIEIWATLGDTWRSDVLPALKEVWAALGELAEALSFSAEHGNGLDVVMTAVKLTLIAVKNQIDMMVPMIQIMGDAFSYVAGVTTGFLADVTALVDAFTSLNDTSISLQERMLGLSTAFMGFMIPDELVPGSPTPFEMGLRGIADVAAGALPGSFTTFWAMVTEQTSAFIEGPLFNFETHLQTIITVTLPQMSATYQTAMGAMTASMQPVTAKLQEMITLLAGVAAEASATAKAVEKAMSSMTSRISKAADRIKSELIPAINQATAAFDKMAAAATKAARGSAGAGATAPKGNEFQHGTGGIRTVPAGFNNDSYRAMLTSGEQFAVAPRGVNLREMLGLAGNNTVINMTNNITTSQPAREIVHSLELMRSMAPG